MKNTNKPSKPLISFSCIFLTLVINVIIVSCGPKPIEYKIEADVSSTFCSFKDSLTSFERASIFIEASSGMRGFINPPNQSDDGFVLKTVLPKLATDLQSTVAETRIVVQTMSREPISSSQLFSRLTNRSLFRHGAYSNLGNYFPQIIKETRANELSFLISDCIYDVVGAENLAKQREVTDLIYSSLESKNWLAAMVFVFHSEFDGDWYYDMTTHNRPFNGRGITLKNRPFYVWVFGSQQNLREFSEKNIIADYDHVFSYGMYPEDSPNFELIKAYKTGKVAVLSDNRFVAHKPKSGDVFKFLLGVDLIKYSTAMQDTSFLNQNLVLDKPYLREVIHFKSFKVDGYTSSLERINNKTKLALDKELNPFTHVIEIEINSINEIPDQTFKISLSNREPAWIQNIYLRNDIGLSPEELEGKTPLFHLVSKAFSDRYLSEECSLFQIVLTKKN